MYDILIAGGGTAGLSAAIYGVRAGKKVIVLEQKSYGGQIVNSKEIVNYPGIPKISGFEFAKGLYEQATGLGAEYRLGKVIHIERVANGESQNAEKGEESYLFVTARNTDGTIQSYRTRTVILATGAKNRPLGLDREDVLTGAGVSYCATCDGMFFRGKDVAVVGGGNTALEDALFLSGYCHRVYLIHRREEFRGEEKLLGNLREKENVVFVVNSVVQELMGDTVLSGVKIRDTVSGEVSELPVSGLFVAIGQMPDNGDFENLVELDDKGYILAGEDCMTDTEGIFTAGDCRTKIVRQLATAASDGAVAALAACELIG